MKVWRDGGTENFSCSVLAQGEKMMNYNVLMRVSIFLCDGFQIGRVGGKHFAFARVVCGAARWAREVRRVVVKGKSAPLRVHVLIGITDQPEGHKR